jgi:hypothetical protein
MCRRKLNRATARKFDGTEKFDMLETTEIPLMKIYADDGSEA